MGYSRLRFSEYAKDLSNAVLGLSMQFDLGRISKGDLIKELDRGDVAAGSTDRVMSWRDKQILEVKWTSPETKRMSITGITHGAIEAKFAEIKKKAQARLAAGLARVDIAHDAGLAKVDAALDDVVEKINKEIDEQIQEFAQTTNGGPA